MIRPSVIAALEQERTRQQSKWGEQNHAPDRWALILTEECGEAAKAALEAVVTDWPDVKTLRVHEMRKELIEVAAVAIAAIESLDRNELTPKQ